MKLLTWLTRNTASFVGFIILIPIAFYYTWVIRFSVDCPQIDDFAVLLTSIALQKATSFSEWCYYLFSFHNEHRIVVTRLVFIVLAFFNEGFVNIKWVILIGNFALMGLLILFLKGFKTTQNATWYFLPVPFLLFQMQFFENTFFAMASVQNLGIWLGAGLTFWVLTSSQQHKSWLDKPFIGGTILATITALTSGNGILVFPIGILIYLQKGDIKKIILWLILTAIACFSYLKGLSTGQESKVIDPLKMAHGAFGYLGAFVGMSTNPILPALLGLILVLIAIVLSISILPFVKGVVQSISERLQLFLVAFFTFLFLTACLISVHRDLAAVMSTPRYKIASALSLITIYLMVINTVLPLAIKRFLGIGSSLITTAFCLLTYQKMTPIIKEDKAILLQSEQLFYLKMKGTTGTPIAFEQEWRRAVQANIWRFSSNVRK